jgi:cytochrome c-type biogenesis protein CcmH/NrfG
MAESNTHSALLGGAYLAWARALRAEGMTAEAKAAYASALTELTPTMGADNPKTREAADALTAMEPPAGTHGPPPTPTLPRIPP